MRLDVGLKLLQGAKVCVGILPVEFRVGVVVDKINLPDVPVGVEILFFVS